MSKGIRRYGSGKFNTILDSIVHAMTMDGTCESCGDVSEVGFYASKVDLGPDSVEDAEKLAKELDDDTLTEDEKDRLRESVGAIVVESEQGLVTVDYYDNKKEFDKDWEEVEDDASLDDEEDEGEEAETETAQEEGE